MRSSVEAVIFDYGYVLSRYQMPSDIEKLEALSGVSGPRFLELYWGGRGIYDRGEQDGEQFWRALARAEGKTLSAETLDALIEADTESWARLDPAMIGWLEELQSRGMKTAILSNMGVDLFRHASRHFAWFGRCDHRTISCDVRAIKPERAIYEHCLRGLGLEAGRALFIDDRQENIDAARALGMQGIVFKDDEAFDAQAAAFGLPRPRRLAEAGR